MSLAAAGRIRMNMCTSLVCIDENSNFQISGRIYHTYFDEANEKGWKGVSGRKEGKNFRSLLELIEILEDIYDDLDYPQNSVELREFVQNDQKIIHQAAKKVSSENGKLATFTLRVMFRQNASWQGTVRWMEQNKTENFRSVLELIHLLDSVKVKSIDLYETDETEQDIKIRKVT